MFSTNLEAYLNELKDRAQQEFENQLIIHAKNGDLKKVQITLQKKVNIDAQDEKGYTALHYAVENNHPAIVEYLLNLGADQTIEGKDNFTAEQIATGGDKQMMNIFEKRNTDDIENQIFNEVLLTKLKECLTYQNFIELLEHADKNSKNEIITFFAFNNSIFYQILKNYFSGDTIKEFVNDILIKDGLYFKIFANDHEYEKIFSIIGNDENVKKVFSEIISNSEYYQSSFKRFKYYDQQKLPKLVISKIYDNLNEGDIFKLFYLGKIREKKKLDFMKQQIHKKFTCIFGKQKPIEENSKKRKREFK